MTGTNPAAAATIRPGISLRFALLVGAFFLSGFGALIYQIVWQRMLGMFAGSDAVTAAIVVGAFLLGLGVGTLAASLFADRLSAARALVAFAACELGIGAFALLSRAFLYDFVVAELGPVVQSRWTVFGVSFLGLLVPTFLMGLSLPILSRAAVERLETAAGRIGWLYGANTLGAGVGALIAGWLLVGLFGYEGAIRIGAGLNAAAALIALGLIGGRRGPPVRQPGAADRGPSATNAGPGFGLATWCLLVFVSGFGIVALEILWVRVLGVTAQYNAYSFASILGIFLLADGAGMAAASVLLARVRDPRPAFFVLQAAAALYALLTIWGVAVLQGWPALGDMVAVDAWRLRGEGLIAVLALTVIAVAPPSFLLGASFPLVQKAVQRDLAKVGARVGVVQLTNIVGNAAGSLFTGLVALHWLGTAGATRLIAVLAILLLLAWLAHLAWRRTSAGAAAPAAVGLALLAGAAAFPGNAAFWTRLHRVQPAETAILAEDRSGIALLRLADDRGPLFIQGFTQSTLPFLPVHAFLGAVGPLVHPNPDSVFVIGVGSGGTPYAAGINPATRAVRAIELVRPVYAVLGDYAATRPDSAVGRMLADARFELIEGDGRREIFAGGQRYDVIESDAILPESSHSGLLYSREFMEAIRDSLNPGGIAVQWAPTARTLATFRSVHRYVVVVRPFNVLLGSDQPIPFARPQLTARLTEPAVSAYLRAAGVDPAALARGIEAEPLRFGPANPPAAEALNTDLFPRDELYLNNSAERTLR